LSPQSLHEDLSREDEIKPGSARSFGLVFAGVFLLAGLAPMFHSVSPRPWPLGISVSLLACALLAPRLLHPLNLIWFRFGRVLHKVVSPVILAILFYVSIVPIALLLKVLRKDPLGLRFDRQRSSYWIMRDTQDIEAETMRRQF